MRVRVAVGALADALAGLGTATDDLSDGLVIGPAAELANWRDVEDELARIFELTREASIAGAPVLYVVDVDDLFGRGDACGAALAAGLLSGVRALAFEGQRAGQVANVVARSSSVGAQSVADVVRWVIHNRDLSGQVVVVGNEHLGALSP
jgi:hypothetical protein